jgi:choline dehydrogenase-like flavoprotein
MKRVTADVAIIGSGIGGATMAYALAGTGVSVVVLERGPRLLDTPETRDDRAIYQRGHFRNAENWSDAAGERFNPGNFYYVGGNSKFYGGVMFRYRSEDFEPREHADGVSLGWPFSYDDLEPWYAMAERLFSVHGALGDDPTEPPHSTQYPYPPVPDETAIAIVRHRLVQAGVHPASLPLAVDHNRWLSRAQTPWDGYPDTFTGKCDAESGPLAKALEQPGVSLMPQVRISYLATTKDGKFVARAHGLGPEGEVTVSAGTFVLAAGAINSAAILLRSGIANGSDQVGRNFMNHNCTAMVVIDPRLRNTAIYQKTLYFNDFYLNDPKTSLPLGNIQLLGKISGPIFKANLPFLPEIIARALARYSVDWYLMSEDLPNPASRIRLNGDEIVLDWQRTNMRAHATLVQRSREVFRAAGFPIVLSRAFDKRTPSHQCGTVRMGNDPTSSVVDPDCRAHDLRNLYVTDAGVLPTSAAVNPALTTAAVTLRAAKKLRRVLGVDVSEQLGELR